MDPKVLILTTFLNGVAVAIGLEVLRRIINK